MIFRSNDGKILLVSSEDGYCTFISFDPEELGDLHQDPLKNSDDKSPTANQNGFATAKKQIQTENKPNLIISEPESLKNDKIAQNSQLKYQIFLFLLVVFKYFLFVALKTLAELVSLLSTPFPLQIRTLRR